jgi:hypothetical protein
LPARKSSGDASIWRLQSMKVRGTRQRTIATARRGSAATRAAAVAGGQLGRAGVGVDVKEVDQVGRQRASELGRVVIVVGGLGRAVGDLDQEVEVGAGGGAAVDRDLDDVGDGRRQGHGATLPRSRPPRAHRAVDRVT